MTRPGRYAVLTPDGVVENVILCQPTDRLPGRRLVAIDDRAVQIGDTYDGTQFARPATATACPPLMSASWCGCLDAYKQALYDRIAHVRAVKEGAGVQFKGATYNTDAASQIRYMASTLLAVQDPAYWGMFPTAGGRYVRLSQDDVLQLCAVAAAYVNACLLEEAQLQQRVDAALTVQDLQAVEAALPAVP